MPQRHSAAAYRKDTSFTPQTILRAESLVKVYGKRRVVDGVSFHVNKGEIVGLLGPNGAGKTTSFRMTCGLIGSNGGSVYLGPHDVTNWPMFRRSREGGMGYLPQEKSVFQKLSVQSNLYGVMELLGIKRSIRKRRCDELLEKFGLTHLRRNLGGGLSGGERRRLEIARSLVSNPKIILLDEPFAAVDPITVTGIQKIIKQLSDEGISILITDHSVQDTLQITQRSYVIEKGHVLCHGTPAEVLSNPQARKAYFGENVNIEQIQSSSIISPGGISSSLSSPYSYSTGDSSQVLSDIESSIGEESPLKKTVVSKSEQKSNAEERETSPPETKSRILRIRPSETGHAHPAASRPRPEAAESPDPNGPPVGPEAAASHPKLNPNLSGVQTRAMGKRLVPTASSVIHPHHAASGRPLVQSSSQPVRPTSPSLPDSGIIPVAPPRPKVSPSIPDEPEPGSSGVIRSLGNLIWGRK